MNYDVDQLAPDEVEAVQTGLIDGDFDSFDAMLFGAALDRRAAELAGEAA